MNRNDFDAYTFMEAIPFPSKKPSKEVGNSYGRNSDLATEHELFT